MALVWERYGRWSSGARYLLKQLAKLAEHNLRYTKAEFTAKWRVRVSVAMVKAYGAANQRRVHALTPGAGMGVEQAGDLVEHVGGGGG